MRAKLFFALVLLYCNSCFSQHQDSLKIKDSFKVGLLKMVNSQFFAGFEFKINSNIALNIEAGYIGKAIYLEVADRDHTVATIRTENQKFSQLFRMPSKTENGFQINSDIRMYLGGFNEVFFGIKLGYQTVNFGDNFKVSYHYDLYGPSFTKKEIKAEQEKYFLGVILGKNIWAHRNAFVEINGLIGCQFLKLNQETNVTPYPPGSTFHFFNNQNNGVFAPMFNLNVNIAFKL